MAKARRIFLPALLAIWAGASADTGRDALPSAPYPALQAAPLFYILVPNPLGARTWAEQEVETIRLGTEVLREQPTAAQTFLLLSLHCPYSATAYALEMMEAPREEAPATRTSPVGTVLPGATEVSAREISALEAMGLKPEDLVEKPELPAAALALADAIAVLDSLLFREGVQERTKGQDVHALRVEAEEERIPQARLYQKPAPDPRPQPPVMIFAKRITRSVYKVLLGIAIGVLIWGFVRSS